MLKVSYFPRSILFYETKGRINSEKFRIYFNSFILYETHETSSYAICFT